MQLYHSSSFSIATAKAILWFVVFIYIFVVLLHYSVHKLLNAAEIRRNWIL